MVEQLLHSEAFQLANTMVASVGVVKSAPILLSMGYIAGADA